MTTIVINLFEEGVCKIHGEVLSLDSNIVKIRVEEVKDSDDYNIGFENTVMTIPLNKINFIFDDEVRE